MQGIKYLSGMPPSGLEAVQDNSSEARYIVEDEKGRRYIVGKDTLSGLGICSTGLGFLPALASAGLKLVGKLIKKKKQPVAEPAQLTSQPASAGLLSSLASSNPVLSSLQNKVSQIANRNNLNISNIKALLRDTQQEQENIKNQLSKQDGLVATSNNQLEKFLSQFQLLERTLNERLAKLETQQQQAELMKAIQAEQEKNKQITGQGIDTKTLVIGAAAVTGIYLLTRSPIGRPSGVGSSLNGVKHKSILKSKTKTGTVTI